MQETCDQSLGQEDPLEKEMAIHSSILPWRIPWTDECGRLQSIESQRVGHDLATTSLLLTWLRKDFPGGSDGKRLSTTWETQVRSLGREDPLEKEMATHSSTIARKIPWMEEPGRLQAMGSQRVGHDWATSLHFFTSLSNYTTIFPYIC